MQLTVASLTHESRSRTRSSRDLRVIVFSYGPILATEIALPFDRIVGHDRHFQRDVFTCARPGSPFLETSFAAASAYEGGGNNSISKMSVAFGGILPPAVPVDP